MGTLLKLACRNAFRYKRRTVITFSAVSLGLAFLILGISLLNGFDKQAMTTLINSQTSHLKILKKGYFEKKDDLPLDMVIPEPHRVRSLLNGVPGIKASQCRVLFACGLIKGMDELPCMGVAIEPELDPNVFNIKQSLRDGEWLEPGESKILIGKDLAEDVGLQVGDMITLRMITSSVKDDFTWNAMDMEIKGIFDSGNPMVDNQRVIIPIETAREGLSLGEAATEIVIRLNSDDEQELLTVTNRIQDILSAENLPLETVSWKKLAGIYIELNKSKKKRSAAIIFIMLFIASLGIINTMMMAVFERTKEIGMLAAMGMKKKEIIRLFLLEGGFIGLMGSLLGCILGSLGGWYLETKGWALTGMGETFRDIVSSTFPMKDVMYGELSVDIVVITFVLGTGISLLASLYPAYRAVKLNPIEALRHV